MRSENPAQASGIDGTSRWIGMRRDGADEGDPTVSIASFTIVPRRDA